MDVTVKLFATLRNYLPQGNDDYAARLTVEDGSRVEDIMKKLAIPEEMPTIMLLNGKHSEKDAVLREGDVLSIFPPLAGGANSRAA